MRTFAFRVTFNKTFSHILTEALLVLFAKNRSPIAFLISLHTLSTYYKPSMQNAPSTFLP